MGIGAITPSAAGSVTAPTTGFPTFTFPTPATVRTNDVLPISTVDLPELRGVMFADGVSALRHIVTNVLRTGPLAPSAALTATPTAARAEAWLKFTGNPSDGDGIVLLGGNGGTSVKFKTTLVTDGTLGTQVKIGAGGTAAQNLDTTITNLYNLFNNIGSQGDTWWNVHINNGQDPYDLPTLFDVDCIAADTTNDIAKFRARTFGTIGNGYPATESGGSHAFYKKDGTTATTVMADGAAGTGQDPAAGTYSYGYSYLRDEDGAQSGISPVVEVVAGGNGNVNLSVIATGNDADMDQKRWFRTVTGGNVYNRGYDIPTASTTDTDDRSDDDITAEGNVAYDEGIHRAYEAGYPPKVRWLARFKGRVFGGGAWLDADTASGFTASVTVGSRTVSLNTGNPTTAWEGRALYLSGLGLPYRIIRVDASSTGTLYVDREVEATNATIGYTVKDDRNPYEVFYSEPLLPNNWPVSNSIVGVTGVSGDGITGMVEAWESLIIFTRDGVWRLTGDGPGSFQLHQDSKGAGCVSGHTVRMVDGLLYWLGADGIYAWGGQGDPTKISSPDSGGQRTLGIDDTVARLNLAHAHLSHAHYDPEAQILRFFVPLDTDNTCRWAIVLDLQAGAWALDTVEDYTCVASVRKPNGSRVTLAGEIMGILWQTDLSNSDGVYGAESVRTVTTGGDTSTIVHTTSASYSGSTVGAPAWHISTTGDLTRHRLASTSGNNLGLARRVTSAVTTGYTVAGGIPLHLKTGRFHLDAPEQKKVVAAIRLFFDVDVDGEVFLAWAKDQGTPTVRTADPSVDLTTTDGERRVKVQLEGRSHQMELVAIEPGCDPQLFGYALEMRGVD